MGYKKQILSLKEAFYEMGENKTTIRLLPSEVISLL